MKAEDLQLVRQQTGRNDSGTEDHRLSVSASTFRAAKAAYPSSVLMNIIPAEGGRGRGDRHGNPSGQRRKVNPVTLTAAHLAGATEVYKVGGAQAIAALAFGTGKHPRVNKIVGPGNIFVALAKKAVYGHVSIDSIAGPSEILVWPMRGQTPVRGGGSLISGGAR